MASAFVAAVFYLFPNLLPFFSPGKRPLAYGADFNGQVLLFDVFQRLLVLVLNWLF